MVFWRVGPKDWARDPVSRVFSLETFRRIIAGDQLETAEDEVLHQLASQVASYPLTLFHSLRSFGLLPSGKDTTLVIHVIGAEADKEGNYAQEIQSMLQTLVGLSQLLLVYIGPSNVASDQGLQEHAKHFQRLRSQPQRGHASSFYFRGTYAEFLASDLYSSPSLVMAFHPGFHDSTYPWWPTLQFLLHEDVPLALTCFSEQDLNDTKQMIVEGNEVFRAKVAFEFRNPFASHFVTPAREGKNVPRACNMHLLGWQGILKRFPKGGGVLDGSHMEVMAMCTMQAVSTAATPAQHYILQERARSYLHFAAALERRRPCVGQKLISEEMPEVWKQLMGPLC